jgi:alpha-tubulin suppressor-like RCC1 family protein
MHTLVLSNKGRIFSCGFGETYALGHGTNKTYNYFREMGCLGDMLRMVDKKI